MEEIVIFSGKPHKDGAGKRSFAVIRDSGTYNASNRGSWYSSKKDAKAAAAAWCEANPELASPVEISEPGE